jgi:hypothetical protein
MRDKPPRARRITDPLKNKSSGLVLAASPLFINVSLRKGLEQVSSEALGRSRSTVSLMHQNLTLGAQSVADNTRNVCWTWRSGRAAFTHATFRTEALASYLDTRRARESED